MRFTNNRRQRRMAHPAVLALVFREAIRAARPDLAGPVVTVHNGSASLAWAHETEEST